MDHNSRRAFCHLAWREWKSTKYLLLGCSAIIVVNTIVPVLAQHGSLQNVLGWVYKLASLATLVLIIQYVQASILAEKARGTFTFLRSLPLSDAQILGAKVAAIGFNMILIYVLPTAASFVWLAQIGAPVDRFRMWTAFWVWMWLLAIGAALAGSAILFQSRVFMPLPLLVSLLPILVLWYVDVRQPQLWSQMLAVRAYEWASPLAILMVYASWRFARWAFEGKDIQVMVD
jgi:ABC-type transport system involved in multi-copper enzyme maturation permease subunit